MWMTKYSTGVMSGAVFMSANNDEKPTVKSILVQILAEV